ncbi:MAG: hypothetical protein AB8H80_15795 [Planctomycetota bacterium]
MSLRLWIVAVALGSFATGLVVGTAVPTLLAGEREVDEDESYVRLMATDYRLDAEQQLSLRAVLRDRRRREMEILRDADWSQLPQELRSEKLAARRRTEQRIRFVLDERQRALYDRDSRPGNSVGNPAAGNAAAGGAAASGRQDNR